jgi:hypothetical protein
MIIVPAEQKVGAKIEVLWPGYGLRYSQGRSPAVLSTTRRAHAGSDMVS